MDFREIRIRKVVLKPMQKSGTNIVKSKDKCVDWDAEVVTLSSQTLPLSRLCK